MKKAPHIALFVPSLRGGGAERVMVTLANSMAERGLEVDLLLAQAEGPFLNEVSGQVRVVDLKAKRVARCLPRLIFYLFRKRPDAVLSTLRHANVAASVAHFVAHSKARIILREASHLELESAGYLGRINSLIHKFAYRRASAVIAVSKGVADYLHQQIGLNRIVVINNPIDIEMVDRLAGQQNGPFFVKKLPTAVAVGRLAPAKDYPTLIKAFARLQTMVDSQLYILGEGEDRPKLERLIDSLNLSDKVFLPGFIGNPFPWMSKADVFVMSSLREGFPNAMVQAMACGAAVVSTDCDSGPREILEGGKWGALVPVGDVGALCEALSAAMQQSTRIDTRKGALRFDKNVSIDKYIDTIIPSRDR